MASGAKSQSKNLSRASRKPSQQRYKAEMRWEKNAKRRAARHAKRVQKHAAHLAKRRAAGKLSKRERLLALNIKK